MPRTKRPVKRLENVSENDDMKKLDRTVIEQKKKLDSRAQMEIRNIQLAFKILIGSLSNQTLHKTVGELKSELQLPTVTGRSTQHTGRSASYDDGYVTENSSQNSGERGKKKLGGIPVSTTRSTARRSRSADVASRRPPTTGTVTKPSSRRLSRSVYRTPAYNKNAPTLYPPITPKVAPQTPLTVLRQPRQGEMVVSMAGSPVMVPTYNNLQQDEMANCNILLQDGTMLSVQPRQLRESQAYIPFSLIGPTGLAQLQTIIDNLGKVVRLGGKTTD